MTDKVHPSFGRRPRSREVAQAAIAYGGGTVAGFVWPATSRLVEDSEGNLTAGALGAFDETSGGASLDVTIASGEAVVFGAYLARDVDTTVTLPGSTTTTISVGWKDGQPDTVLIGEVGTAVGDTFTADDAHTEIWEFTTDGSGVTGVVDLRRLADDWRIPSADVEALKNFAEGDVFSGLPLSSADLAADSVGPSELNVDTDDVPEGLANEYFTAERAQDAVGTIMVGANDATVTYDDAAGTITIDVDHLTAEQVEDIVAGLVVAGTDITVAYDDGAGTLTIAHGNTGGATNVDTSALSVIDNLSFDANGHVTGRGTRDISESVRDLVAGFILGGTDLTVTHDDAGDTLTVAHANTGGAADRDTSGLGVIDNISFDARGHATGTGTRDISESVRDLVAGFLAAGSQVDVSHDDVANTFTIAHADTSSQADVDTGGGADHTVIRAITVDGNGHVTDITTKEMDEAVEDIVGSLVAGGTDITASYDDAAGTLTLAHTDTSSQGNVDTSGAVVIDSISLDGRGHVTAISTRTFAHVNDTTNPHSVTDSQTGAATALSNHSADADAHHTKTPPYTDGEARAATASDDDILGDVTKYEADVGDTVTQTVTLLDLTGTGVLISGFLQVTNRRPEVWYTIDGGTRQEYRVTTNSRHTIFPTIKFTTSLFIQLRDPNAGGTVNSGRGTAWVLQP